MKKFKFSLDTVLSYKQQVLEALQGEHALALAAVREQEALLDLMGKYVETLRRETRPLTQKRAKGKDI